MPERGIGTATTMAMTTHDPTSCGAPLAGDVGGNGCPSPQPPLIESVMMTTLPNWKLYFNPFYDSPLTPTDPHKSSSGMNSDPLAWYQRRIKALEEQQARNRSLVADLRVELDLTRRKMAEMKEAARRGECENERMRKLLDRERAGRVVAERVCDELAREIGRDRVEEMRRECERTTDVRREDRIQMKLAEARRVLDRRVSDLDVAGTKKKAVESPPPVSAPPSTNAAGSVGLNKQTMIENPHIKMGIKGFVEFSRVLRSGGLKGKRTTGSSKADCQKSLLRPYFLKQRDPVGLSAGRPENLVMV